MPEPLPDPADLSGSTVPVAAGVQTLTLETAPPTPLVVEKSATKRLGIVGWIAIIWIVAVVGSAVFASLLPIPRPDQKFLALAGEGPQMAKT